MGHGTPDWGVTAGAATVYQLTDLGELAVRLGSIVTHDRRGDVIFLDDFEGGLVAWLRTYGGDGADVQPSIARARSGHYSALLRAGSNVPRLAGLIHRQGFPALGVFGAEFSWVRETDIETLKMEFNLNTIPHFIRAAMRYEEATNELQYLNSAGGWVAFATGIDPTTRLHTFQTWKLVFDAVSQVYVRAIYNDVTYLLTDIPVQVEPIPLAPHLDYRVELVGRAAQNDEVYVDDVILTQNEPVG